MASRKVCAVGLVVAILCAGAIGLVVLVSTHRGSAAQSNSDEAQITKLDLATYPTARCLDGTPGAYYILPGDSNRWVVHLQGGGECVTESECHARKLTKLGSSNFLPTQLHFDYPGILANANAELNPALANATMVYVPYCSGDLHSGQTDKSSRKTFDLFFNGHTIVHSVLRELVGTHGLLDAELLVWTGESAGGIGSVLNLDFAADLLHQAGSAVRVVGAPLAGFYFSNDEPYTQKDAKPYIPWTRASFVKYTSLWNSFLPTRCAAAHKGEEGLCLVSNYSVSTLSSEVMFFAAQTDSRVLALHDGVPGEPPFTGERLRCVEDFRDLDRRLLRRAARPGVGVFNPACWTHTNFLGITLGQRTYQAAFAEFLNGNRSLFLQDDCSFVNCNPTCPGPGLLPLVTNSDESGVVIYF